MKLVVRLKNAYKRSGFWGTLATCARALAFYAKEQTPARRRARQRDRERDAEFDRRFGVKTGGYIDLADLAILPTDNRLFGARYEPTSEVTFREMLSAVPAKLENFVFVDIGSGLGRVLLLASEYPFRAIRGVEFSPDLHAIATENIRRYRSDTQKCTDIASICQDATQFEIPEQQAFLYFYNPFEEPVMRQVVANIEQSLRKHPRDVYLLYYNPKSRQIIDWSPMFRLIHEDSVFCIYCSRVKRADDTQYQNADTQA